MRKIIPTRWDVPPDSDLGRMVYFTLKKQIVSVRTNSSHPGELSPQSRWDLT